MSETATPEKIDARTARNRIIRWFEEHEMNAFVTQDAGGGVRDTMCVYRGNSDPASEKRCAAGCLIPDDLYDPMMEGKSFCLGPEYWEKVRDLFTLDGVEFVRSAQNHHDGIVDEAFKMGIPASTEKFISLLREVPILEASS